MNKFQINNPNPYFQLPTGSPCQPGSACPSGCHVCFMCCQPGSAGLSSGPSAGLSASHFQERTAERQLNPEVVEEELPVLKPPPIVKQQYIPFQRKVIEMVQEEEEVQVPVHRSRIVMQEVKRIERVPVQKKIIDYYKVEVKRQYVQKEVQEQKIERVPVTKIIKKPVYIPVERETVHYPEEQVHQLASSNLSAQQEPLKASGFDRTATRVRVDSAGQGTEERIAESSIRLMQSNVVQRRTIN